jgi:hypothetical protein
MYKIKNESIIKLKHRIKQQNSKNISEKWVRNRKSPKLLKKSKTE